MVKNKKQVYLPGKPKDTHFKNMEAFRKYTAYLHIHNIPHHKAQSVYIAGMPHKLNCKECK